MLALQDYRAVVALLEERHFGRAARRLGVTQPALTARLRRIEDGLGARLFERGRAGSSTRRRRRPGRRRAPCRASARPSGSA